MKKDFFKGRRVFISGGAGVIGRELVRYLHARGAVMLVGDLQLRPTEFPAAVHYRMGDLNYITKEELDAFRPEIFFHLAASFERSDESYGFWDEQWHNNARLSHHLLTLLKDSSALRSIIFASSYLIYDKQLYMSSAPMDIPVSLKEGDAVTPRNLTGASKLGHEIELDFIKKHTRKTVICARIYRGYGRGSRDVISRFVRDVLVGKKITLYQENNMFDYIFARDSAEALARLAASGKNGIFNVGTGKSRTVGDVAKVLQEQVPGTKVVRLPAPGLPFEASQAEMSRFESVTQWRPRISLESGIREIVRHERRSGVSRAPGRAEGNILVTSASGKIPLLHAVRHAMAKAGSKSLLYGGDVNKDALAKYIVDRFLIIPNTIDANVRSILAYCQTNDIRCIIPTRDGELRFWASHAAIFKRAGIAVMVSGVKTISVTLDKLAFYRWSRAHDFAVIQTAAHIDDIKAERLVVKERFGAGSRGIGIDLTREQAVQHAGMLEEPLFQPYIKGREYSVDVFVSRRGVAKGSIVRERVIVVGGESQVTTVVPNAYLSSTCESMAEQLGIRGHAVFQVIMDRKRKAHIIECNARFGGASTTSIAAGLDTFYWWFAECAGDDLSAHPFVPKKKLTMVRFKKDHFIT